MNTYNCTVNSAAHTWRVAAFGLGFDLEVSRRISNPSSPDRRFDFMLVNSNDTSGFIVSQMSFTSFAGLDDAGISCVDSVALVGREDINIVVLGKPSLCAYKCSDLEYSYHSELYFLY
jgi:hypothetical protein